MVLFRTMHDTLNSVLSRVGSLTTLVTEANQVQQECASTESALNSMHDRLNVGATNYSPTDARSVPYINHIIACSDDRAVTKTYAAAAASPTQKSLRATREPNDYTSKTQLHSVLTNNRMTQSPRTPRKRKQISPIASHPCSSLQDENKRYFALCGQH